MGEITKWGHCSRGLWQAGPDVGWSGLETVLLSRVSGVKKVAASFSSMLRGEKGERPQLQEALTPHSPMETPEGGACWNVPRRKVPSQSRKELGEIAQLLCNGPERRKAGHKRMGWKNPPLPLK